MAITISNTGVLYSNTGLLDEIGQYMTFYDEANTTLYFDATGRFPYSTATSGTWLNLAPTAKLIVGNTTALGATVANTYGPNAMIFNNSATTAGRIDRTAASNTIINPGITSGTGKMTAAVWAYNTNWYQTTQQRFVSSTQTGGWSIAINDGGFTGTTSVGVVFYNITAGGYRFMEANTRNAFASSTGWNHLAWTFDGKNAYFYINGQVANTYSAAAATNYIDVGGCLAIGAESSGAATTTTPYLSGAIASIFVSNRAFSNTEIYNLFVDTDPNITLPGSRTYVVNSTYSTNTTIIPNTSAKFYSNGGLRATGTIGFDEVSMNSGSLFFDGSTQYLTGLATPAALGTGNFTIEMWVNPTAVSSSSGYCLLDTRPAGSGSTGWVVTIQSGNITIQNNGTQYLTSSGTISAGVWSHIACVRVGTTVTIYINGVASGTATNSTDHTASLFGVAKPTFTSSSQLNYGGYITNLRIVPGIAQYTSNFTSPSSSVLVAVANTSLLLQVANSSAYITDSSPNQYTITNNGSATYNTNSIFNYTASGKVVQKVYLDGTFSVANTFDETVSTLTLSALLVGGGGGGAGSSGAGGAGGGAGGVVSLSNIQLSKGVPITVTVGPGGSGGTSSSEPGVSGGNTVFSGYTAYGGGGGKDAAGTQSGNGGSGGGAVDGGVTRGGGGKGVYPGSTYISDTRQGYDGSIGSGDRAKTTVAGGGGGGAGGAGADGYYTSNLSPNYFAGTGGAGLANSISGSSVTYAGGGGGGQGNAGGASGAGPGGGGGGARGIGGFTGAAGNTGIVIITYSGPQAATGGTVTTVGANTVHTFTANGTFIP
jgi:Concanavalin A-like lectin/glucanases superfamily